MAFTMFSVFHWLLLVAGSSSKEAKRPRVASLLPDHFSVSDRPEKKQRVEDESEYEDEALYQGQDVDVDLKDLLADGESDIVVETDGLIHVGPQLTMSWTVGPHFLYVEFAEPFIVSGGRIARRQDTRRITSSTEGQLVYLQTLQLAQKYGLTPAEFEYYLTIKAPRQERIFHPYHVLSRCQAEAYGWLELVGYHRALHTTATLRKLGTVKMSTLTSAPMFWMVHYFCNKDQALKTQRPSGASWEEIRFHILDRWNLHLAP
ncbi:hypothetical protein NCS56_01388600 [Fusarium sp. Ph1]|nr:hypothetical protein NCS56_01388600 [Fusarium sp. Ph1]